ncbi:MAG: FAD-binding oxidoreductase [Alphaproteobacteria bacterium]|nr:FAD-binding oxidoreductase [Alphaproteobacteria bacterium]
MHSGYPGSWYQASAQETARPALRSDIVADVCIVGGGFTGLSAACTLAEAGLSVVLLEAKAIGWGASGRNGGQLIRGFVGQEKFAKYTGIDGREAVKALTWAGHDLIRRRIDEYGFDCDLTPGWLEVAHTPRQLAALYHHYNEMETSFPDRGWLFMGANELESAIGTSRYVGGLLSMSDGHLHPLKLCLGLARGAEGLGAKVFEQSKVLDIIPEQHKVRVETEHGCVEAQHVVMAANVHHHLQVGKLQGSASAAGSYLIATEPLRQEQLQALNPNRWAICDSRKVCDYFRMSADGRVLFGGRVNYSGRKPRSIEDKLLPRLLKVWPELEGVRVEYAWGGRLGVPYGEVPLVGRVGENVWYGGGYTGHGVNMGNIVGDMIGKAIIGEGAVFDLFNKMPKRRVPFGHFSCGRWLGQQAVSLAILYYWIKDRL